MLANAIAYKLGTKNIHTLLVNIDLIVIVVVRGLPFLWLYEALKRCQRVNVKGAYLVGANAFRERYILRTLGRA